MTQPILISKLDAMLCALAGALDQTTLTRLLDGIDWAEAGVSREEFDNWWSAHQMEDAHRRRREADAKHREELRLAKR